MAMMDGFITNRPFFLFIISGKKVYFKILIADGNKQEKRLRIMARKQNFGIKYPFKTDGFQKFYVDVNDTLKAKARSQLMHIVFTPKGQRIRMPDFGTDLIKYIFEQNDNVSWEAIKSEVSDSVSRWATNITVRDIQVVKNEEDESEVFVRIDYSVTEGNKVTNDSVAVQI
jgi:phage baseplate assembly protein W